MDTNQNWNLLAKYLADEANENEVAAVENWIQESPENRRLFLFLKTIWSQEPESFPVDEFDVEEVLQATHLEMKRRVAQKENHFSRIFRFRYVAAAAVAIFAILSIFWLQTSIFSEQLTFQTQVGESSEFYLPDSSAVILAPDSKLRLASTFATESREVFLEGEAFFKVKRDSLHPFLVNVGSSEIRVLGTQFGVKAYKDETEVKVVVREGSVGINKVTDNSRAYDSKLIIKRKDLIKYNNSTMEVLELQRDTDITSHLKWIEGVIFLDNVSLTEVGKKLEHWYPVQFSFQNQEVSRLKLTTQFSSQQSLEEILDAIALALQVKYKRDQAVVIFYN